MSPLRCSHIFILLLIDGLRHTTLVHCGDPSCPRTLHDCDSVEQELLTSIDVILTPGFMLHVYDYENIADICRFFKTPSCSDGILATCKGEVVYSSRAFKSRQQTICGDTLIYKDMSKFKNCAQSRRRHIGQCLKKRTDRLEEASYAAHASNADHPWCNITSEYISCVYGVIGLGCSVDIAEEYQKTVNQSLPVVEAVFGYSCSFGHPLDVLKTTTPPPESTPNSINRVAGVYTGYGRRPTRHSRGNGGKSVVLHGAGGVGVGALAIAVLSASAISRVFIFGVLSCIGVSGGRLWGR